MFEMDDCHKRIFIHLAGKKTPEQPRDIEEYLETEGIVRTLQAITIACQKSLSGVLICHAGGTLHQKRCKYSAKSGFSTLRIIADSFDDPDSQHEFLKLSFYRDQLPKLVGCFSDAHPLSELQNDPTIPIDIHGTISRRIFDEECINPDTLGFVVYGIKNVGGNFLVVYGTKKQIIANEDGVDEVVSNIVKSRGLASDHGEFLKTHLKADMRDLKLNGSIIILNHRMSDADKKCLTTVLKSSWVAFKFVIHFIYADYDKRIKIMSLIRHLASDRRMSPYVAYEKGWGDALVHLMEIGKITDDEAVQVFTNNILETRQLTTNWDELLNQVSSFDLLQQLLFDKTKTQRSVEEPRSDLIQPQTLHGEVPRT